MKVSSSHCLKCTGVHWLSAPIPEETVCLSCDVGWMSLSVCSPSPVSLETLAVFLYKEFYLHLALLLRLFYTFYCFYFIVYFSADSSGCDVCGLEGGICLQSIYCLFICTGLSHPEVRRPLSLELQSRLWDPAPLPETCASIGVSVMPTLYVDFQLFSVRTAVNSTSQVTSVCHHPKLASFSLFFFKCFLTNVCSSV